MSECKLCNKNASNASRVGECGHIICHQCLCKHLIPLPTSAMVKCFVKDCEKIICDYLVRKCLSNDQLNGYDVLSYGPKSVKCLIKECPYFVSYVEKEGHFICGLCGQPNCITCGKLHIQDEHCNFVKDYNPIPYIEASKIRLQQHRKAHIEMLSDNNDLIPNPELFDCEICFEFFLPRKGVMLRNCHHTFCKPCLDGNFKAADNLRGLCCPLKDCSKKLAERESRAFIGKEKLQEFGMNIVKTKYFHCQTPECKGLWDFSNFLGDFTCQICNKVHCGACRDIHEGKSCDEFRQTSRYKDANAFIEQIKVGKSINCKACQTIIKKGDGCNALRCPTCILQVCAYSGEEIGPKGCKCTNEERCHPDCAPGCIPDGDTPYEKTLYDFFWGSS